jgi:hypothetical protein
VRHGSVAAGAGSLVCTRGSDQAPASGPSTSPLAGEGDSVPLGREYVGSALLIITGTSLDPGQVTRLIRMRPSQYWRRGEIKRVGRLTFSSTHNEGGWKAHAPASVRNRPIEVQLKWWVKRLTSVASNIRRLRTQGNYCRLSWFIATHATASLVIPSSLQVALAKLHLDWEVSVHVGRNASELAS